MSISQSFNQIGRIILLHVLVYLLVILYCLFGAAIFITIEGPKNPDWNFSAAYLFSHSLISTIGYGNLKLVSTKAELFALVFSIIGIPLWLLALADFGQYLSKAILLLSALVHRKLGKPIPQTHSEEIPLFGITLLFIFYVLAGVMFSFIGKDMTPFESIYLTFISITSIGLGDIFPSPSRPVLMLSLLAYFSLGLAIATLFVQRFSDVFRRFHYYGIRIKNSKLIKVWIGRKKTTIGRLAENVLKATGISQAKIKTAINELDHIVESDSTSTVFQQNLNGKTPKVDEASQLPATTRGPCLLTPRISVATGMSCNQQTQTSNLRHDVSTENLAIQVTDEFPKGCTNSSCQTDVNEVTPKASVSPKSAGPLLDIGCQAHPDTSVHDTQTGLVLMSSSMQTDRKGKIETQASRRRHKRAGYLEKTISSTRKFSGV